MPKKAVVTMSYSPTLIEGDAANMQTAEVDMKIGNPVKLTYGIYR